jgi:DNA-binding MarR family transcriptional regulator
MREFIRTLKDAGLSPSQLNTLMRLHYRGPCPISEVGDDLGVTTAAASQLVERLVQQGLIERGEDPADRRVRRIRLTPQGKALIARGVEARVGWVGGLMGVIPVEEQSHAADVLRRLTGAARALDAEPTIADETRGPR